MKIPFYSSLRNFLLLRRVRKNMKIPSSFIGNVYYIYDNENFHRSMNYLLDNSINAQHFVYLVENFIPICEWYYFSDVSTIFNLFVLLLIERRITDDGIVRGEQFYIDVFSLFLKKYKFLDITSVTSLETDICSHLRICGLFQLAEYCSDVSRYKLLENITDKYCIL